MPKRIEGFSKLTQEEKIDWISQTHFKNPTLAAALLHSYWNPDAMLQQRHEEFTENTVSNFYLPLGVAPNFLINEQWYTLPMVIEESSVVAAACKAAKFWMHRGGFQTRVVATEKVGQIHFLYQGDEKKLKDFIQLHQTQLIDSTRHLTKNMRARGGGITALELNDQRSLMPHYFQLHLTFETGDAMGANFINSCLEEIAVHLKNLASQYAVFSTLEKQLEIVMCILSNYVPNCLVTAKVSCPIEALGAQKPWNAHEFAEKLVQAVTIAQEEPFRAVTHNKGIMNGVDALVIATGNDFRAIEAGVHAYAARSGKYKSLSSAWIEEEQFSMELQIPLALGTVGGLTGLHPMVGWCHELLGNPDAKTLMQITAVAGLAQNFAALQSLVTSGIQKGHMKMHLVNILNQAQATKMQKEKALSHFKNRPVSVQAVTAFLDEHKNK
ncbi:hydroxymethylglutaryl-CoA reductase, degradative [Flavobacteriaceae bacterium]|jgi:hydroxymethylglutaryl-CoA reductase|nr:hydroxymethylglutaryl-CoA reductase, degradative [Flavobacteriaceae bacterium]MDA8900114.1 hydroxymethylglutaryl-CoA reductase, degradative [Flavobacteriaceae bacterium]